MFGIPITIQAIQNAHEDDHQITITTAVSVPSITVSSQTQAIVPDNDHERDQVFVAYMTTIHEQTFDEIGALSMKARTDTNNLRLYEAAADSELVANRYETVEKDAAGWDGPLATKTRMVARNCKDSYMNASEVLQNSAEGKIDEDALADATQKINDCTAALVDLTNDVDQVRMSGD